MATTEAEACLPIDFQWRIAVIATHFSWPRPFFVFVMTHAGALYHNVFISSIPKTMVYPPFLTKLLDTGINPGVAGGGVPPTLHEDFVLFPGHLQAQRVIVLVKVGYLQSMQPVQR
jgi:hypothetical protein